MKLLEIACHTTIRHCLEVEEDNNTIKDYWRDEQGNWTTVINYDIHSEEQGIDGDLAERLENLYQEYKYLC
jgi:hypothetical protein